MLQQGLGIQFDLACRRGETSGDAVLLLSELAVACLERHPHPARVLAQRHERNAGWVELIAVSGLHVTVPEMGTQAKAARQVEDELGIDIEVERGQSLTPSPAVSVGDEQVGAEPDESSYWVGPLLQDRPVDLV